MRLTRPSAVRITAPPGAATRAEVRPRANQTKAKQNEGKGNFRMLPPPPTARGSPRRSACRHTSPGGISTHPQLGAASGAACPSPPRPPARRARRRARRWPRPRARRPRSRRAPWPWHRSSSRPAASRRGAARCARTKCPNLNVSRRSDFGFQSWQSEACPGASLHVPCRQCAGCHALKLCNRPRTRPGSSPQGWCATTHDATRRAGDNTTTPACSNLDAPCFERRIPQGLGPRPPEGRAHWSVRTPTVCRKVAP